jgi:hypothetical protein
MSVDWLGQGSRPPATGGVELTGVRQWVRSLLVFPGLFATVVVICALAGATHWPVILAVTSALTVVFEVLLVRNGVTSLVVSPSAVVRRNRRRTTTVRAEDVRDILVRHVMNGPVMVISTRSNKVGLSLPVVYRKPMARDVLTSFLRRAGVDLPSLRGLGLPGPVSAPRTVAGPILSHPAWPAPVPRTSWSRRHGHPDDGNFVDASDEFGGSGLSPGDWSGDLSADLSGKRADPDGPPGRPGRPSVRVGGRALTWVSLAALALSAAIGLLRLFS